MIDEELSSADQIALRDATLVWFEDEMERCPRCGGFVPESELEALIDTLPICRNCRWDRKWDLLAALKEKETWPLGLA